MKEIKFRCLDKKSNTIIQWEYLLEYSKMDGFLNEDFIFMQYTGLKDKNGKEIYVGDILFSETLPSIHCIGCDRIGKVIFNNGKFIMEGTATHENGLKMHGIEYWNLFDVGNKSIIKGNIYENPELIK